MCPKFIIRLTMLWSLTALLICNPESSIANMLLSQAIVHFTPDDPKRQDIEVMNVGEEPLYIVVEPYQVQNPGLETESRTKIQNPREAGLLVSPNKMVIPPGGRKLVRFVKIGVSKENDRVFRILLRPVVGDVYSDKTALKIVIAYEVLVLMQPELPQPKLIAERKGRILYFENTGNTNILLREGKQCETDSTPPEQCTILQGKRLYAKDKWSVELPFDRPVEYYQVIGNKNLAEVYQ